MKMSRVLPIILFTSLLGGLMSIGIYKMFIEKPMYKNLSSQQTVVFSKYRSTANSSYQVPEGLNFVNAAAQVTPAVVHIRSFYGSYNREDNEAIDLFRDFFGRNPYPPQQDRKISSGSGVIITTEGYIATNNHVIEGASRIEVVLEDKREYKAEVIGTDISTDLALIKIDEKNLPFIPYGDAKKIKVGEWVLAVGNPFDLTSTVTAGIVSAKARNINIIGQRAGRYSIEAFIQTDAAVNPGNSGGALVDLNGRLIGINTAIATNTGSYSGYSFAVPVTLVKKVMDDLANYGEVKRAFMGVSIQDVNAEIAKQENLDEIEGVYIQGVSEGGAADDAKIQAGDIILSIDGVKVNSASELQEQVALHRPGDKIEIIYIHNNQRKKTTLVLKNKNNTTDIAKSNTNNQALRIPELGAKLAPASKEDLERLGLNKGVKVVELYPGRLRIARVREGFIITHVDKEAVENPRDILDILNNKRGGVLIEGMYPDGTKEYIGLGF